MADEAEKIALSDGQHQQDTDHQDHTEKQQQQHHDNQTHNKPHKKKKKKKPKDEDAKESLGAKCYPGGVCYAYTMSICISVGGFIVLIALSVYIVHPYMQALGYAATNCSALEVTGMGVRNCNYGSSKNRRYADYPCQRIKVRFSDAQDNLGEGVLYQDEGDLAKGECSFRPRCTASEAFMENKVLEFVEKYGSPETTYTCLYDPSRPNSIILQVGSNRTTALACVLVPVFITVFFIGMLIFLHFRFGSLTKVLKDTQEESKRNRDKKYSRANMSNSTHVPNSV